MPGPVAPVLDLDLVKQHIGVDGSDHDELIQAFILTAIDVVETETDLVLQPDDERIETFDAFNDPIRLRAWPVREIVSISYVDTGFAPQTVAAIDRRGALARRPARLLPAFGSGGWPLAASGPDAITVTFKAGYADPAQIPGGIVGALLMLIGHLWQYRDGVEQAGAVAAMPIGVEIMLRPHRMVRI